MRSYVLSRAYLDLSFGCAVPSRLSLVDEYFDPWSPLPTSLPHRQNPIIRYEDTTMTMDPKDRTTLLMNATPADTGALAWMSSRHVSRTFSLRTVCVASPSSHRLLFFELSRVPSCLSSLPSRSVSSRAATISLWFRGLRVCRYTGISCLPPTMISLTTFLTPLDQRTTPLRLPWSRFYPWTSRTDSSYISILLIALLFLRPRLPITILNAWLRSITRHPSSTSFHHALPPFLPAWYLFPRHADIDHGPGDS